MNQGSQAFDRNNFVNQEIGYQQDVEDYGLSAEINWEVRGGTLTSITSYRDWDYDRSMDIDFTAVDILRRNENGYQQEFETLTQELRFAHTVGRLDWLVGFYYVDEDLSLDDAVKSGRDYEAYVDGVATGDPTSGLLSLLTGLPQGQVFTEDNGVVRDLFEVETTSWAFFTHNVFHMNENWDFTLGLRYTDEEKDLDSSLLADNPGCLSIIQNPLAPAQIVGLTCLPFFSPLVDGQYSGSRSDEEWTGVLSVQYNFNEDWMGYVSASRGYKAGGYNLDRAGLGNPLLGMIPDATDLEFEAETVDSYEIGAKGTLLDERMSLNIAAWFADYEDFQLNTFTGTAFVVNNLSGVESTGIEVESTAYLYEGLTLQGGFSYTDARYDDDVGDPALNGNRLTNAPFWIVTVAANYQRPLFTDYLGWININYRFNDDMNTGSNLAPEKNQPGYSVWNGRIGFGPDDEFWRIELWGNNLFDQDYNQIQFDQPIQTGTFGTFLAEPRTWGVTARINF